MSPALTPGEVWREWQSALRRYIARQIREPSDVDDVLQEIFLKIQAHLSRLREPGRVAAWLYRIADTAIADHYRSRRRWEELSDELPAPEKSEDRAAELIACLKPMVDALPEIYRNAVWLSEMEGLTQQHVAERLGLSLSGAKSRVQRGRAKLRELMLECCHVEADGQELTYKLRDTGRRFC